MALCKGNRNYISKLKDVQIKILYVVAKNESSGTPVTTLTDIRQLLSLTYRQTNYNVNELLNRGFLKKDPGSVLLVQVTEKAKAYIEQRFGDSQIDASYVNAFLDRAHRITIKQPIIQRGSKPPNFAERDASKLHWKNGIIYSGTFERVFIEIKSASIIYHFQECFGPDAHTITFKALTFCFRFAKTLKECGWRLNLPATVVIQQEHALFNEILGQFTRKYNLQYKSDRLTFDGSIQPNEFELTHPLYAPEDFHRLTDFLEAIIREKVNIEDLITIIKLKPQIEAFLHTIEQQQQVADKNVNQEEPKVQDG